MGDEGLALGCALGTLKKLHINFKPIKADTMYLGAEYSENEVFDSAKSELKNYNIQPLDFSYVADLLLDKKIIGLYQGKSEHGPRALGNRSIICDATNPETYDILNSKLKRNDFMPDVVECRIVDSAVYDDNLQPAGVNRIVEVYYGCGDFRGSIAPVNVTKALETWFNGL